MSDKVEISSFFWKLGCSTWCFSGNCLLRGCFTEADTQQGMRCFAEAETFRDCMVFGESINGTPQTVRWCFCITTLCDALLVFTSCATFRWSLFFNGLHFVERNSPKKLLVLFRLLPLTHDLARPGGFCWMEPWLLIGVWCFLLDWTDGILITKSSVTPKNYFKTGPQSLFPINLLSPQALVSGLEERLKRSRTLNKVGLEKSKPRVW